MPTITQALHPALSARRLRRGLRLRGRTTSSKRRPPSGPSSLEQYEDAGALPDTTRASSSRRFFMRLATLGAISGRYQAPAERVASESGAHAPRLLTAPSGINSLLRKALWPPARCSAASCFRALSDRTKPASGFSGGLISNIMNFTNWSCALQELNTHQVKCIPPYFFLV
jgi:hypothetical protein